jgi:hypothetical protein
MMIVKADNRTEAGVLPTQTDIAAMGRYNEELIKAPAKAASRSGPSASSWHEAPR